MTWSGIIKRSVVGSVLVVQVWAAQLPQRETTSIRINAARTLHSIPRSIYGTFLEPIGNSIYGGLWAEILQNPSFEANLWVPSQIVDMIKERPELAKSSGMTLPLPWEPLDYAQGARYAPHWKDTANSYQSLLLMALPNQVETGIRQRVYLPVHRINTYVGSVYLKLISGPAEVRVSIRKSNDKEKVFAAQTVHLAGTDWRRYPFSLQVPAGQLVPLEPADFVIAVENGTRILIDQASLVPSDNINGMDPDMVQMSRALKTPIVRFGGNFTSAYRWRDGIGPRDQRISMLNIAWGMPEYNQFGTDEFLDFCRLIGAEPQIALNLGTGTPEEAAGWVKYVDDHWATGGGRLWELGNELWGNFQVGYPTLSAVAERTKAFSEAVRRVDPNARVVATGADPDNFREWNTSQLSNAPEDFRYLSTHFVVTTNDVVAPTPSPDFIAKATFALPVGIERLLHEMHNQFSTKPEAADVKTAFTEWLFWAPNDTYPRYDNMGGAVAAGSFLNMLIRNAPLVPVADMTGIIEFGGLWKKRGRVYGVPAYWAFKMYSTADASRIVETQTHGEVYNVEQGSTRIPTIPDVPYLDVVSTLNEAGTKLTIFCVNRDLSRDITARIDIAGFSSAPLGTVRTLTASSIYETNDEVQPQHIHTRESSVSISMPGFQYTFPHEGITLIELTRR